MAKIRLLRRSEYRQVAWKNGGGTTAEIATEPSSASVAEAFAWRLSLADVKDSGPFSTFPGCDRIIVQLSGAPMRLRHGKAVTRDLQLFEPHLFSGDDETVATLITPARDFNCIVRRSVFTTDARSLLLHSEEALSLEVGAWLFIHALEGEALAAGDGTQLRVATGDTLIAGSEAATTGKIAVQATIPCRILILKLQAV